MPGEGRIAAEHLWKRFRTDRAKREVRDVLRRLSERREPGERWRWALRDVHLSAEPGEAIGLIGANGSGKSTLLKILSGVMYPYAGKLAVAGRIGALIEVRAGIHPELSGRENIELYGSLLGHRRRTVARRFDEIVAFAELSDAIDRQVKFYSTGMQMRLGFAVAAFLEPDVLLVDEVLAVGDASFQQRCLDRMRAVLEQGTTLVLVSHDLAAVEATCARGVWLQQGVVRADGPVREVLAAYRQWIDELAAGLEEVAGVVRLVKTSVGGGVRSSGPLAVDLVLESPRDLPAAVFIGVTEGTATPTVLVRRELTLPRGETELHCDIAALPLPRGRFYVWVGVFDGRRDLLPWHPAAAFDVEGEDLERAPYGIVRLAPIAVETRWRERHGGRPG